MLPLSQDFSLISQFWSLLWLYFSLPHPALSCTSPLTPFPEICDKHCLGNSILPGVSACLQWMWGHVLCLHSQWDKKWRVECCVWERNFLLWFWHQQRREGQLLASLCEVWELLLWWLKGLIDLLVRGLGRERLGGFFCGRAHPGHPYKMLAMHG